MPVSDSLGVIMTRPDGLPLTFTDHCLDNNLPDWAAFTSAFLGRFGRSLLPLEPLDTITTSTMHLAIPAAPPVKQVDTILPATPAAPMDDVLSATTTSKSITIAETQDDSPSTSAISVSLIPSQPQLLDAFCILDAFDGCAPVFADFPHLGDPPSSPDNSSSLIKESFTVLVSSGHPETTVTPSSSLKPLHSRLLDAIAGELDFCLDHNEESFVLLLPATPATRPPVSKPVPPDYLDCISAVIPSLNTQLLNTDKMLSFPVNQTLAPPNNVICIWCALVWIQLSDELFNIIPPPQPPIHMDQKAPQPATFVASSLIFCGGSVVTSTGSTRSGERFSHDLGAEDSQRPHIFMETSHE
jgi:hypothetical protein